VAGRPVLDRQPRFYLSAPVLSADGSLERPGGLEDAGRELPGPSDQDFRAARAQLAEPFPRTWAAPDDGSLQKPLPGAPPPTLGWRARLTPLRGDGKTSRAPKPTTMIAGLMKTSKQ